MIKIEKKKHHVIITKLIKRANPSMLIKLNQKLMIKRKFLDKIKNDIKNDKVFIIIITITKNKNNIGLPLY